MRMSKRIGIPAVFFSSGLGGSVYAGEVPLEGAVAIEEAAASGAGGGEESAWGFHSRRRRSVGMALTFIAWVARESTAVSGACAGLIPGFIPGGSVSLRVG